MDNEEARMRWGIDGHFDNLSGVNCIMCSATQYK